jgi:hypothetical protein
VRVVSSCVGTEHCSVPTSRDIVIFQDPKRYQYLSVF